MKHQKEGVSRAPEQKTSCRSYCVGKFKNARMKVAIQLLSVLLAALLPQPLYPVPW